MASPHAQQVQLLDWRLGYFPHRFRWRGQVHQVLHVQRIWEECRDWPRRRQYRYYRLLCSAGLFVLRHDLLHNLWQVVSAPAFEPRSQWGEVPQRRSGYAGRFAVVR
ncbi:MAG: hypothetical protein H5T60_05850 [Anaerolineae bacterium]|nr:hypothetical protein [Anaerolineae bacterium]